jgi:hypothetical protein
VFQQEVDFTQVKYVSATQLTAVSPAHQAETVDVQVFDGAATSPVNSPGDWFTFLAPYVTGISPASGPTGGDTQVIISGVNFSPSDQVIFAGSSVALFTQVTYVSATELTAVSPAQTAGTGDLRILSAGLVSRPTAPPISSPSWPRR